MVFGRQPWSAGDFCRFICSGVALECCGCCCCCCDGSCHCCDSSRSNTSQQNRINGAAQQTFSQPKTQTQIAPVKFHAKLHEVALGEPPRIPLKAGLNPLTPVAKKPETEVMV